jgi:antitoxin ParD1/3/4
MGCKLTGGCALSRTLNLSLTDELRAFIDQNCGDGTLYATPSEFVRDVLRDKKNRLEAARIRDAILDGYQDAINGRTVSYRGDLRRMIKKAAD